MLLLTPCSSGAHVFVTNIADDSVSIIEVSQQHVLATVSVANGIM